ncbi:MAG: hypothetical protein ABUT20_20260 [Bacteroidota bacterium]
MKNLRVCIPVFFVALLALISCQKEKSYELSKIPAHGSLQSDLNQECLPKTVSGAYIGGKAVTDSNYIDIEINVTSAGVYSITTDTLNGYSFSGKGNFTTTGVNTVKLAALGTPIAAGINNFLITFDSTFCYVPVTVLPVGTGAATFTLQGSGSTCLNSVVSGTYVSGVALTLDNKVAIQVNVTKIGTYNISTTATNGMVFAGTGVLAATGIQTITLTGSGTPSNEENSVISISAGISSCTFTVNVTSSSNFDYFPRTANSNWSYDFKDDVNDSLLIVSIPQTVNLLGSSYNVFVQTDDASLGYDSSGYYRKSGNDYYSTLDVGSLIGYDNPVWIEQIFLKDNATTGTTWVTNGFSGNLSPLGQLTLRIRYTILQKDVSVTVKGTAYPNTIVVQEKIERNTSGSTWTDMTSVFGTINSSYSRNIGLIKQEQLNATGTVMDKMELRRYQVF